MNMIFNRQDAKVATKSHFSDFETWRSWRLGG
jgi:hypothetical protein